MLRLWHSQIIVHSARSSAADGNMVSSCRSLWSDVPAYTLGSVESAGSNRPLEHRLLVASQQERVLLGIESRNDEVLSLVLEALVLSELVVLEIGGRES